MDALSQMQWDDVKSFIASLYESKSVHTVGPTNALEELWISIVNYLGDFHLLVAFYFFMNTCYFFGGLAFWIIDRLDLMPNYKIQHNRYASNREYWQCTVNLVVNYIIIIFPLLYTSYPLFTLLNFTTALPLPPAYEYFGQIIFFAIAEDFAHYWLHRGLHTQYFYKRIHKVHHQFAAPFGLSASYSHPIEVLVLGFATFFGPLIVKPHFFTFYSWVLFRQLDAVATHCGYDFLDRLTNFIPFYGGTLTHDYHHKSFIYNYGSRFTYLDKLFGTYREPKY